MNAAPPDARLFLARLSFGCMDSRFLTVTFKRRLRDDNGILANNLASIDLLPLAELLVTPPGERERFLLRSIDPRYWFPGDDEP